MCTRKSPIKHSVSNILIGFKLLCFHIYQCFQFGQNIPTVPITFLLIGTAKLLVIPCLMLAKLSEDLYSNTDKNVKWYRQFFFINS